MYLAILASLLLAPAVRARGMCDKLCCPCYCCDGLASNGQCSSSSTTPLCVNAVEECSSMCLALRGADGNACQLAWSAYPTEDCQSCRRATVARTDEVLQKKPFFQDSLIGPLQVVQEESDAELDGYIDWAMEIEGNITGAKLDVASSVDFSPEAQENIPPTEGPGCTKTCCSCQCCTRAGGEAGSPTCYEKDRQNICISGGGRGCDQACSDWKGADGYSCTRGWPRVNFVVDQCSECV